MSLRARPPFSLASIIRSHGWIRLAPFVEDTSARGFYYTVQLATGRVVRFLVTEADGDVRVVTNIDVNEEESAELAEKVSWMLGLDQDFSAFYALCGSEPKLAHVQAQAQGRLLRSPTLFEDVVKTILTTNTAWSGTIRMTDAFVQTYGAPVDGYDRASAAVRAFPTPGAVARASETELRHAAKLGYRAPYILELAQRVESGDLDLEALRATDLETEELRKRLLAIKGVGGYAAANLLLLLGRYDYLPVDSWARKMVSQEWYGGQPVGENEVEAAFAGWGEYAALAYCFWNWESAT